MGNEINKVAEAKAAAISKIANSKHFIIITDNGEKENNLSSGMMINSPITALEFLKLLKQLEWAILNPQLTPPPSNLIKA